MVDDGEQVPAGWCEVGIVGHLEMGLLTPARSSGRRRYTIDDVYRAATLRGKQAGLSLDQIEQVISPPIRPRASASCVRTAKSYNAAPPPSTRLKIIDSVLRGRQRNVAQCPHYQKVINDRIGVPTPSS